MLDSASLRRFIYDEILAGGFPPASVRIASHFGVEPKQALNALAALKIGKTALLHADTGEIWMAGPFAAGPTEYSIVSGQKRWWANCAWDMLGVASIVNAPVRLESACTECSEPFVMALDPRGDVSEDWVVHFLLPARRWYDDIGFT